MLGRYVSTESPGRFCDGPHPPDGPPPASRIQAVRDITVPLGVIQEWVNQLSLELEEVLGHHQASADLVNEHIQHAWMDFWVRELHSATALLNDQLRD